MTVSKRVDVLKKMGNKIAKGVMVKMLLAVLIDYKSKKVTTKVQKEKRAEVVERLTKGLNEAGKDVLAGLVSHNPKESGFYVDLSTELNKKLDDMLVDILGSSEAVDAVFHRVKYN